jgi:hypothetical protein
MPRQNAPERRYKWRITLTIDGEDLRTLYSGFASTDSLGHAFAAWTQNRCDLSGWDDARRFGEIVARYSDLRTPVVAVWLCLDPDELSAPLAPEGLSVPEQNLKWDFEGPDGNPMQLARATKD